MGKSIFCLNIIMWKYFKGEHQIGRKKKKGNAKVCRDMDIQIICNWLDASRQPQTLLSIWKRNCFWLALFLKEVFEEKNGTVARSMW